MENLWVINEVDDSKKTQDLFKLLEENGKNLTNLSKGKLVCDVKEKTSIFDVIQKYKFDPYTPNSGIDISKNDGVKNYFYNIATSNYDYYFTIFTFKIGETFPLEVEIDSDVAKDLSLFSKTIRFDTLKEFRDFLPRIIKTSRVSNMVNRLFYLSKLAEKNDVDENDETKNSF